MLVLWTPFLVLPAEHGMTKVQSHPSDSLEDAEGDVAQHVQGELEQEQLGKTGHDFPFNRFHYMLCIFCDLQVKSAIK